MKKIIFLLACTFMLQFSQAQVAVAKLKYEDAELAYSEGDYQTTVNKLEEAEKLFGKKNPPILYLRIMAQKKLWENDNDVYGQGWIDLLRKLQTNTAFYLKQYESLENNEDKYRDVYNVSEQIKYHPRSTEFFLADSEQKKKSYREALKLYNQAATKGDAYAYTRIGLLYVGEVLGTPDYKEALKYFEKATEKGDRAALYFIGTMYYSGNGVEKSRDKALTYYEQSAAKGYAPAMFAIGEMYDYGYGVTASTESALKWYTKAAEAGHAEAMNEAGWAYWQGRGTSKDYSLALKYFSGAAAKGYATGMRNMGNLYYDGSGVEKDRRKALEWYKKAADLGHGVAMHDVADIYWNARIGTADYNEGIRWYKKSADNGYVKAMRDLGKIYKDGTGVGKDYDEALRWYTKAAVDKDDRESMYWVGYLLENADNYKRKPDYEQAFTWYERSANKDYAQAMTALGNLYAKGKGVKKDKGLSKEWNAKAITAAAKK